MYEFMRSHCVAEVQDGKVKYFKEYSEHGRIVFRNEITERAFVHYEETKYSERAKEFATEKLVTTIADMLNNGTLREKAFINAMDKEHRALQGDFACLIRNWLEHCASDEYQVDGRNQIVKTLAVALRSAL